MRYRIFQRILVAPLFVIIQSSFASANTHNEATTFASISCEAVKQEAICTYNHPRRMDVKNLRAKINDTDVKIIGVKAYPASPKESTAILFLLDTSDPRRKETIKAAVSHVNKMMGLKKAHHKIGVSVFDSEYKSSLAIGADTGPLSQQSSAGKGQATELYKNALKAIDELKQVSASRKGLIVLSDGKAEDTAYKLEDVVSEAIKENITIMSLGYAEKDSETPSLQTLKRMADDTGGEYHQIKVGDKTTLPNDVLGAPFAFVESGGQIIISTAGFIGESTVSLRLILGNKEEKYLSTQLAIEDRRSQMDRVGDYIVLNWMYVFPAALLFMIFIYIATKAIMSRRAKGKATVYGYLEELDGSRTRHVIKKTAIRIGRSKDNDVCLSNDSISGHHAEIYMRREGGFYIVDLASTNGVIVNDQKTEQAELLSGDSIELGEVRLRFVC